MSKQKEQTIENVADAFVNICACVILDDLTIDDIVNGLKKHPFVIDKTEDQIVKCEFNLVVNVLKIAVAIIEGKLNNEPDRR